MCADIDIFFLFTPWQKKKKKPTCGPSKFGDQEFKSGL